MHALLFFVRGLQDIMKPKYLWRTLSLASMLTALMFANAVQAGAEEEKLPDRFMVRLGGYAIQSAEHYRAS